MSLSENDVRVGQIWKTKSASYIITKVEEPKRKHRLMDINDCKRVFTIVNIADDSKVFEKYYTVFASMELISDVESSKENTNG